MRDRFIEQDSGSGRLPRQHTAGRGALLRIGGVGLVLALGLGLMIWFVLAPGLVLPGFVPAARAGESSSLGPEAAAKVQGPATVVPDAVSPEPGLAAGNATTAQAHAAARAQKRVASMPPSVGGSDHASAGPGERMEIRGERSGGEVPAHDLDAVLRAASKRAAVLRSDAQEDGAHRQGRLRRGQEDVVDEPGQRADLEPGGSGSPARAAEPLPRPAVERRALEVAAEGAPFADARAGGAFEEVVLRLRAQPAPADEVYALVTVTDRRSGDRRVFARGTPRPEVAEFLRHPERAPAGEAYAESDHYFASDGFEVATRAVTRRTTSVRTTSVTDEEERELELRERNRDGGLGHRIDGDLRRKILSGELRLDSDEQVPLVVHLRNVPPLDLPKVRDITAGGLLLAGLDLKAERERRIIERKREVLKMQRPVVEALRASGALLLQSSWTAGSIRAYAPARMIPRLADRSDVFRLDSFRKPTLEGHWRGDDYYAAMDVQDFDPDHLGQHGDQDKHSYDSGVVVALVDVCLDEGNPAWLDGGPGSFNRLAAYDCDPILVSGCSGPGGVENCEDDDCSSSEECHGTDVAQLMAADFMSGQDPGIGSPTDRQLTGICPNCRLLFFQDEDPFPQYTASWDQACDFGVDIFNFSWGLGESCNGGGPDDEDLEAFINCDAVFVKSAGNEGTAGGDCSTTYPADHPWTFAVGGIATRNNGLSCDTAGEYYTASCIYDTGASMGGMGSENDVTIIDMAAPYRLGNMIFPDTSPVTFRNWQGTSFSAPIVSGLMGVLLDWWDVHVSQTLFYNNRLRNFMLLFGDRSSGSTGSSRHDEGFDIRWGAGRVGLFPFDSKTDDGIYRTSSDIGADDSWYFRIDIDNDATFFKAVIWHDGKNYSNEPEIGMTLNPVGCDAPTKTSLSLDNKHMVVFADDTDALDGCTHMDVYVYNLKNGSSGERLFHFGAYWATEDERNF